MDPDLNTVSSLAASLPEDEQRELLAELAHKFNTSSNKQHQTADHWSQDERLVYQAIVRVCDDRCPPLEVFSKASRVGRQRIKTELVTWNAFAENSSRSKLTQITRLAVLSLMAECIASVIRRSASTIPVTPENIVVRTHILKAAVDSAYPGSAQCRLLDRVALISGPTVRV